MTSRFAGVGFGIVAILAAGIPLRPLHAETPFRLGVILPFSGVYSPFSEFISAGLKVGVKRVNEAGGILGRPVELVTRDDAGTPGRTLLAAKELVADQKVDALYTGVITGTVLAALPFTTASKVITFSNASGTELGDAARYPYSFQLSDTADVRTPAMAAALKQVGAKSVGLIVSNNPPNAALGDALAQVLTPKYDMTVARLDKFSATEVKDFTPLLQGMRDKGADAIVFDGVGRAGIAGMMTGMQTLGWKAQVVVAPATISGDLSELVPSAVHDQFKGVVYRSTTRLGGQESDVIKRFVADMVSLHITTTSLSWSAFACDSVFALKWGFETAQKQSRKTDADAVKAALETMGSASYPADYSIMFGNIGYRPGDHTTRNADYRQFWSLIGPSSLVDGTYEGVPLKLVE